MFVRTYTIAIQTLPLGLPIHICSAIFHPHHNSYYPVFISSAAGVLFARQTFNLAITANMVDSILCTVYTRWRHQMKTFSVLLAICAWSSAVPGEFPTQRPVTRSFDVFLICTRINSWVNNDEAGDLRCHCAHYGVIVMKNINGPTWNLSNFPGQALSYIMRMCISCWWVHLERCDPNA